MQNNIFGFLNDGSSDIGLKKLNSMCTLIFDVNRSNKVELKCYDMCSTTGEDASKASTLFESIEKAMGRDDIPWENVVSIGLDNGSTNMGKRNSIKSRFLEKNAACFIAGCNCHLAHLAAATGGKAFKDKTGFNVEDHQVDIYYFFKGSTRRKGILIEYLEFTGIEWEIFTRYVSTRWLCLEKCCAKEFKKFRALKSMFLSRRDKDLIDRGTGDEKGSGSRYSRLRKVYENDTREVYLQFYASALPLFTSYNKSLQRSDPLAHKVASVTEELTKKIGMRFLKSDFAYESSLDVSEIEDEKNWLPLDETFVGFIVTRLINRLLEDGTITDHDVNVFLEAARSFYLESLKYVLKKMNMNSPDNEFWRHASWIDFFNRNDAKWSHLEFILTKYKHMLNFKDQEEDLIFEQFTDFKSLDDLPDDILNDAKLEQSNSENAQYRIDTNWYHLQKMKSSCGENFRFHLLFRVALIILLTPHSNAGIERVYSLVNKNKPENSDRNRLNIEGSLSSILSVKLDAPESSTKCYNFKPSSKLSEKAKKATTQYNSEHSK